MKKLNSSITQNYIWNLFGSVFSALISIFLLLIVTRILSSKDSDIFSITYSLSQQLITIGLFQVRNFQATDIEEKYSFKGYLKTRIISIIMMFLVTLGFILLNHYDVYKASILLFIILSRSCDAFSDVYQGYFQQHERSDLSGKILFYRSLATIFVFSITVLFTKSLLVSSFSMFLVNLFLTYILDYRYLKKYKFSEHSLYRAGENWKDICELIRKCFPLFINGFLIIYIFNEPKLVIDSLLMKGQLYNGIQRDFNILFMPSFVLNLMFLVLRPMITQLSAYWYNNEHSKFFSHVKKVYLLMFVTGLIVLLFGYLIGTPVLGLVYGIDLMKYRLELVILLIGGILNIFATLIDNIVTIFRKQHYLVLIYITTFIVAKLITGHLVSSYAILGASISFLISMLVYFVTGGIFYFIILKKLKLERRSS